MNFNAKVLLREKAGVVFSAFTDDILVIFAELKQKASRSAGKVYVILKCRLRVWVHAQPVLTEMSSDFVAQSGA